MGPLASLPSLCLEQPRQILFGYGARHQAIEILRQMGVRSLLLLASNSFLAAHGDRFAELNGQPWELIVDSDMAAEPSVSDLEALLERHRGTRVDAVVAMGGGSVLDLAKLYCVLAGEAAPDVRGLFGQGRVTSRLIPLVAMPTTAGAGSEVSPNAILFDDNSGLKQAVISSRLIPDLACVDPELTLGLPGPITAATGLDALCHCIEAYTNKHAHPLIDTFALQGIGLIAAHLARAVSDGQDREARAALALGSLYGGLCLGPVNTAGVHALAYPLGSSLRLAHGVSNAILLPHVFRFNLEATPARHAAVARALGLPECEDDRTMARAGADRLQHLSLECGIATRLGEWGLQPEQIPSLAAGAMKVDRLLRNNPRPLTQADAAEIYLNAY